MAALLSASVTVPRMVPCPCADATAAAPNDAAARHAAPASRVKSRMMVLWGCTERWKRWVRTEAGRDETAVRRDERPRIENLGAASSSHPPAETIGSHTSNADGALRDQTAAFPRRLARA